MTKKTKKIMAYFGLPLFFLIIGYMILFLLVQPYVRPITSIYAMFSQDQTPDFSKENKNLYSDEDSLPTDGEIDAATIRKVRIREQYGRISIPSVTIDVPLIYGATDECLYIGAGQRVQSDMIGYGKPTMIGGHTIPYFKNLGNIKKNDEIKVSTFYGMFTYKVTHTKVIHESDASAYDLKQNKEQLILFTCYPLDGVGEKEERLLVYADKISGPRVVGNKNEK